jgi:predicted amidophosphoribosyltransferase
MVRCVRRGVTLTRMSAPGPHFRRAAPALRGALDRLCAELTAALAPPACLACRAALRDADAELCVGCRRALPWLPEPRCRRCGLPVPCGRRCAAADAAFERAWAPLAHDGPARALVAALKFRGALPVARLMAAQIAASAPRDMLEGAVLVPVPLHPARRRARGFDQAALIAAELAARTGLPASACLHRRGRPTRQLGAGRADRRGAAARQLLSVDGRPPAYVVLIDDVHTTGATFDAGARALRAAGAANVTAISYARTLPR